MKQNKKNAEQKFDTVGDEYLFLYEFVSTTEYADLLTQMQKTDGTVSIESLRELYTDILKSKKNSILDKKYEDSKRYWFPEQEKAVIEYIKSTDPEERNVIFRVHLYKAFGKLVENIIFTYKLFRSDVDVKDLQADCISFLITKIEKFNPKTGAQAFSYLGTIAKHYLMGEKRMSYKITKSNIDIDDHIEEASAKTENTYHLQDSDEIDVNNKMFENIIKKLEEDIQKPKMSLNDKKVGEAIVYIFKNHQLLEAYNKNKLYMLLKERTGLQTKDITYSLGRFKKEYELFKSDFLLKLDEN